MALDKCFILWTIVVLGTMRLVWVGVRRLKSTLDGCPVIYVLSTSYIVCHFDKFGSETASCAVMFIQLRFIKCTFGTFRSHALYRWLRDFTHTVKFTLKRDKPQANCKARTRTDQSYHTRVLNA